MVMLKVALCHVKLEEKVVTLLLCVCVFGGVFVSCES